MLAQSFAIFAQVPTLYFSGDTDDVTMAERGAAMLTGVRQETIRLAGPQDVPYYESEIAAGTGHIAWDFEPDRGPDEIDEIVKAFGLVYGEWPALVVFDVLMSYAGTDFGSQQDFMLDARRLAASTGAHVMVCHHTVGEWTDRVEAPPRKAIHNKVDQLPSEIMTVGRDDDIWNLALVKSRTTRADPRAERPWQVRVDLDRMMILGEV